MDGEEAVRAVIRPAEELLKFKSVEGFYKCRVLALQFGERAGGILGGKFHEHLDIAELLRQFGDRVDPAAESADFLDLLLGALLIVPKVWLGHRGLQLRETGLKFGQVKGTSAVRPVGPSVRRC